MKRVNYPTAENTVLPYGKSGVAILAALSLCLLIFLSFTGSRVAAQNIYSVAGNGFGSPYPGGFSGDGGTAASAELSNPYGVTTDSAGNMYIADYENNRIRKVDTLGMISTVAGNGKAGDSGDGGAATAAELNAPAGIAADRAGNLYIVDGNNQCIRKVNSAGIIITLAGNGTGGYSGDGGQATAAELNGPAGVASDSGGNIYIADYWNNRIRKVNTNGIISTLAGNGIQGYSGDGGNATAAELNAPTGVATDLAGNIYIADEFNNRIRKVNTANTITTFAGNDTLGYAGDGGLATAAKLFNPAAVATDKAGNVLIADFSNEVIRKVNKGDTINTIAGNGMAGYSGDGGPATASELDAPNGMAADSKGNIFIADGNNNRIREITKGSALAVATIIKKKESILAYPNPTSDKLFVIMPANNSMSSCTIVLTDLAGQRVYKANCEQNMDINTLNVSSLTSGIYFLQVITPDRSYMQKVVVMH